MHATSTLSVSHDLATLCGDHTHGGLRLVHHWTTSVSPQASPAQVSSPAKMQGSRPHPRSQSGRLPELRSLKRAVMTASMTLSLTFVTATVRLFATTLMRKMAAKTLAPLPSQRSSVTPTQPLTQRSSDSASTVVDLSQDSDSEELPLAQPRLVRQNAEEKKQDLPAAAQVAPEDDIGAQPVQKEFQWASKKGHGTWKGHLNFAQFHAWFVASFGELVAYSFVHENGDSAAHYAHTHFAFCLKKKPNTKNSRAFDFDGVHPISNRSRTRRSGRTQ